MKEDSLCGVFKAAIFVLRISGAPTEHLDVKSPVHHMHNIDSTCC